MSELREFFESEWSGTLAAWHEHRAAFRVQTHAASELCIEQARLSEGMRVLDLASGTGEPALLLAQRVGPRGVVVASDLIRGPLELLATEARAASLPQLQIVQTPLETLPFESASFDRVTCRLGFMFSTDVAASLAEVGRVLRPAGRCAFVVWGNPAQALFSSTLAVLDAGFAAAADSGRVLPFRFARCGVLAAALRAAGFVAVEERECSVPWPWPGSAEQMWRAFVGLSGAAFAASVAQASLAAGRDLEREICAQLRRYEANAVTDPGAVLIAVTGQRAS